MVTKALKAQGIAFMRGNAASPEVFTKVAEVLDISGPNMTRTMIDASSLDSTNDEFIPGLKKGGQVTLTCHLVPTDTAQDGVMTDYNNGTLRNWKIELTDSPKTTITFAAYVEALGGPVAGTDGKINRTITVRISGAVTWSS